MNKKLNTALFFLAGTALNLVLILGISLALFIPWVLLFSKKVLPAVNLVVFAVIILGAMAASLVVYRKIVDLFQSKVDMEKYFDPIVRTKNKNLRR